MRQAMALATRLRSEDLAAIFSSDLQRAVQTAKLIAAEHSASVRVDPRLREIDYGDWEGLTREEIAKAHKTIMRPLTDEPRVRFPAGPALDRLKHETQEFLSDILEEFQQETVAVVGHGVSFQIMLYELLDLPFRDYWLLYMYNGSITEVYVQQSQAVLIRLNDTCHNPEAL
jgi:broad specificity phosphatase PhoE